ncbi:hypothetical protein CGMCC3_g17828 [Colletotrichum fructicola]|nr:uncharacterized protein CGMCC3_g17828 [Colletotrichum fructicola]KAE9565991.1 hypothetical protein CGMCC3_g17828 [Colletotrichum fructicola]
MGNLPILYWKCQCGTRNDVKLRTERLKTDRKVCFTGKHCKKCRKKFSHGSIRSGGISPMKDGTEDEEIPEISEEEKRAAGTSNIQVDGLKNVLNNGYSDLQDDEVDRDWHP